MILATVEKEGRSGKLSDQTEVLLYDCSVPISNSESFMGTRSTIIKALYTGKAIYNTSFPSLVFEQKLSNSL